MISIFDYNRKITPLNKTLLVQLMRDSVIDNKNLIIDIQQIQLDKGEGSDGKIIGYYSEATEVLSGGRKRAGDNYNFQDTFRFFRGMFIQVITAPEFQVFIDSKDSKTEELEMKYSGLFGGNFLGIQDKYKKEINEAIRDSFIRKINLQIR